MINKSTVLSLFFLSVFFLSCNNAPSHKVLFDGTEPKEWEINGNIKVTDGILTLTGPDASAILKSGNYKDFELIMKVRTSPGGKGYIAFHTNPEASKGYRISINNDRQDPVWWKMSGSLISVRNLTKSFVKEEEWFQMNIRVDGQMITASINGEPVMEYTEPANPYRTSKSKEVLLSAGTFIIESEGPGRIEFESIEVRPFESTADIREQQRNAIDEQQDEIIKLHQADFPVLDYHVHLKGGLTKETAARQSRKWGINYAIAPNCGIGFPITTNEEIYAFLDTMRTQPFILAMQAEGREWLTTFSPEARNEFDYVFTDALTFTDNKGRRTRLWIKEETWIEDEQQYMDMIVDKICDVLKEPVDIYVNPCYLPDAMSDRYDEFWTEARMDRFVKALAESGKALEINELYSIPNKAIIMKAKEAGVKFTFGSNNVTPEVSNLEYSIRMMKECELTANDMYKPKIKI